MPKLEPRRDGKLPRYAWPGGYPLYYLCADGGELCSLCANKENGSEAAEDHEDPQWQLVACEVNWESLLYCAHCNKQIEAAYTIDVDAAE